MKVGAWLFSYPPHRLLGGEMMTSILLSALAEAGHDVQVATISEVSDYTREGVSVSGRMVDLLNSSGTAPDVFVTHPELAEHVWRRAWGMGCKMVGIVHNLRDQTVAACHEYSWDLLIANSEETARQLNVNCEVIRPPTRLHTAPLHVSPQAVTMVNLNEDKGAQVFLELARRFPHEQFLAVVGGYGQQLLDDLPPNVTLIGQTDAMWMVYGLSKVVLMPSKHETWGMVGAEALALGIPVIASDLPGLREALGVGALYAPVDDADGFEKHLRSLLYGFVDYESAIFRAHTRSGELLQMTAADMARWVALVENLC